MSCGTARHRRGFHVDGIGAIRLAQPGFLFDIGHIGEADQHSVAAARIGSAAVESVDDVTRRERVPDFEFRIQGAGESGRNYHQRVIEVDSSLSGAPGSIGADPAARYNRAFFLEEPEIAPVESTMHSRPVFHERPHFPLESGNDCDLA